jgi:hypothetical protein
MAADVRLDVEKLGTKSYKINILYVCLPSYYKRQLNHHFGNVSKKPPLRSSSSMFIWLCDASGF